MIAGGTAGMILADYGADVVKVEQPGVGDPLRRWTVDGEPFWWKIYGRNKRYITPRWFISCADTTAPSPGRFRPRARIPC